MARAEELSTSKLGSVPFSLRRNLATDWAVEGAAVGAESVVSGSQDESQPVSRRAVASPFTSAAAAVDSAGPELRRAELTASKQPGAASALAGPLPGATALRSERFANQFAQTLLGGTAMSPQLWRSAPGLPSSFSAALQQLGSVDVPSRWAMGPRGLLFVADPLSPSSAADSGARGGSPALLRRVDSPLGASSSVGAGIDLGRAVSVAAPSHAQSGISSSALAAPGQFASPLSFVGGGEGSVPTAARFASGQSGSSAGAALLQPSSAGGQAASLSPSMPRRVNLPGLARAEAGPSLARTLPWLGTGGMGALAELFAASVGLGTGAAASIAQSAGVAAGRAFWPEWLTRLTSSAGDASVLPRLLASLPSLVLPRTVDGLPAQTRSTGSNRTTAFAAPADAGIATAGIAPTGLPRSIGASTGGLAASAESFAKQHGLEVVAPSSARELGPQFRGESAGDEAAGHWMSVSGGMVFVPRDATASLESETTGRPSHTVAATMRSVSSTDSRQGTAQNRAASLVVGSTLDGLDWSRLGGLGLRSELFSSLLGPASPAMASPSSQPQSGWEDSLRLLTSLPAATRGADTGAFAASPRWGWSGAGGLLFVGAPQALREQGTLSSVAPLARRDDGRATGIQSGVSSRPGAAVLPSLPSPIAASQHLADRLSDKHTPTVRSAEPFASPLLSLVEGPSRETAYSRGVGEVQRAFGQRMLTGFPRVAEAPARSGAPTALWPTSTMLQVQRIEKVLSQLPVEWQPSTKVVSAVRQSGIALTPLWQELPRQLNQIRPYEKVETDEESASQPSPYASAAVNRSPALSLVTSANEPGVARREAPPSESARQQSVEKAMQDAVSAMIKSGGQAAASARLLEAIRSHSMPSPTRTDERMSLGDLSLIALSMGEQRIAASSPDHPKDRLEPNVSMALRMKKWKHVEDDKGSYRKAVNEHAQQVVKFMKSQMDQAKQRGQF